MALLQFDGTFDGILSSVFCAYSRHLSVDMLLRDDELPPLFADEPVRVATDGEQSRRVWRALERKMSHGALSALTVSFLAEDRTLDISVFRFIVKVIDAPRSVETDFADPDVAAVVNTARKVRYETHRVLQFMRFQKTSDGTYFGVMEPIYDVMSLAVNHFADRFADQKFLIYDRRRAYGYFYDGTMPRRVEMDPSLPHIATGRLSDDLMDADERLYQQLWRTYFDAVAIRERINPRKQRQDMPVRFWKYMTEVR